MIQLFLIAAALQAGTIKADPAHILTKAFDVSLGTDPGDLAKKGFNKIDGTSTMWSKTGDGYFNLIFVSLFPNVHKVYEISATRHYKSSNADKEMSSCMDDYETVKSTLLIKYPTLNPQPDLPPTIRARLDTVFGKNVETKFEEPSNVVAQPSMARTLDITCSGPSPNVGPNTSLTVRYRVSRAEMAAFSADNNRLRLKDDPARGKLNGFNADNL